MDFFEVTQELLQGFGVTILLFALTWIIAIPLGVLFCRMTLSRLKGLHYFMQGFIWVIRGTPLMLQIIVIFYVPGLLFNWQGIDRFVAVLVALSINYGIYFSEIFRSGYQSVSEGQKDAALMLQFSRSQIFTRVLFLPILKKILPPLSNETISLVKDTALARVIAVSEILLTAQKIVATYAIIWVLFYTGVFYLIFNGVLSVILKKAERKLEYFKA
jgi:amine acid ABC transporter, permease protein, 3-TM region, His/Glu/Gln/Arg/opine family